MRRIALFSDVHGNLDALDAVLTDIAERGLEELYCLGDLVGYGPEPSFVIRRLREEGIPTVQGNYDDGVGNRRGECGCYYYDGEGRADGAASYDYTSKVLQDAEKDWLSALPMQIRSDVGGLRVLLTHGSPRRINEYLLPDRTDELLVRLAEEAKADVICVGHVHVPYHRAIPGGRGSVHYVNTGSVGKPKDGDPRGAWVELLLGDDEEVRKEAADDRSAGGAGDGSVSAGILVHRVPYDVESVAAKMLAAGLPARLAGALRIAR